MCIMKNRLMILLISLMIPICCFSQTTSVDTLKIINIIFAERDKLEIENGLLKNEVKSLKELNDLCSQSDSLKSAEIDLYKEKSNADERKIKRLKKSRRLVGIGTGAGAVLLFILGILI